MLEGSWVSMILRPAVAFSKHVEVTPDLQPQWFLSEDWTSGAPSPWSVLCVGCVGQSCG